MAPTSTALTTKVASGSPYQLDNDQVFKASSALLKHITTETERREASSTKRNLLSSNDDGLDQESSGSNDLPVWLVLTTKKHAVDKKRLKPGKIPIPHSLNSSESLSICIISADPQRAVKDVIEHPSFPATLSSRIQRVIGFTKLKARYQSFESRRQLLDEHDLFLADDRIITRLPNTLGKIFYKGSKRPVPISIAEIERVDGKRVKKDSKKTSGDKAATVASPLIVAKEIERTLQTAFVHLAPATTTAIRIGRANFTPEQIAENVDAVVQGMIDRFVVKGWRNIKAIHIKGANTMALPIWLADELWTDDQDVEEDVAAGDPPKGIEDTEKAGKKRKTITENGDDIQDVSKRSKKVKSKRTDGGDDDEEAVRKAKLRLQKATALENGEENEGLVKDLDLEEKWKKSSHGHKKKRKSAVAA